MRLFFILLLIIHGLIHFLGFNKAFNFFKMDELQRTPSKIEGVFWLFTLLLFLGTTVLFFLKQDYWWMPGLSAIILSQILVIASWHDAKIGTIANIIILVPIIMAFAESRPSSFDNRFQSLVDERLATQPQTELLTVEDMQHLPAPVQKYLDYCGAIGKPKVYNFRAEMDGQIKLNKKGEFLDQTAIQYNFYEDPARLFLIKSKMFGIPMDGLHLYVADSAIMDIKIASLVQVVHAAGKEMNEGETVTMFNDMCFLAPPTLVDKNIQWEPVDSLTAKAQFTNAGNTISAILYFNEKGELINFESDDRYASMDGKTYKKYKWTTPVSDYKEFNGRKRATYGEAIWHHSDGEYVYAKFTFKKIIYNVTNQLGNL